MEREGKPSPSRDCVTIRHARGGGHPGGLSLEENRYWIPAFAGMTPLFHHYDTVSKGRGQMTFDNTEENIRRDLWKKSSLQ